MEYSPIEPAGECRTVYVCLAQEDAQHLSSLGLNAFAANDIAHAKASVQEFSTDISADAILAISAEYVSAFYGYECRIPGDEYSSWAEVPEDEIIYRLETSVFRAAPTPEGVKFNPIGEITGDLPSVPDFPDDILPDDVRPWAIDSAKRLDVPLEMLAIPMMVVLGKAIGTKVAIKPEVNNDWFECPNLWGMVIAPPGYRKTPALNEAIKPLNDLDKEAQEANEKAKEDYRVALEIWQTQKDLAKKEMTKTADTEKYEQVLRYEPQKPAQKRHVVNDATVEKLQELCVDNPDGMLAHFDELVTRLEEWERSDRTADRGFYLTGWSGNSSYTYDRIGRGTGLIKRLCLSVIGTSQPERIANHLHKTQQSHNDGMIQRLQLTVWPDFSHEVRDTDFPADQEVRNRAHECVHYLAKLNPAEVGAQRHYSGIDFLAFDPEAQVEFKRWKTSIDKRVRSGRLSSAIASHLAKFTGLVPSLALILHLTNEAGHGPVSRRAFEQAKRWADYLETHASRLYASTDVAAAKGARSILEKIKDGKLQSGFTARDVYRNGWHGLNQRTTDVSLMKLVEAGYLGIEKTEIGRPTEKFHLNPKAF